MVGRTNAPAKWNIRPCDVVPTYTPLGPAPNRLGLGLRRLLHPTSENRVCLF
jgi:hypothetical protein